MRKNHAAISLLITSTLVIGLAAPAPAAAATPEERIETLTVREHDGSAEVILATSAQTKWMARQLLDGRLLLILPDATFSPAVTDLSFPEGLVDSIRATRGDDGPTLEITPRGRPSYSVAAQPTAVTVTLRQRMRPKAAADPGPVEPSVDPPAPADPPAPSLAPGPEEMAVPMPVSGLRPTGEYRIGPGDVLEISVFGLPDFDRTVRVLRDGSISLPLLGVLRVMGGLTLQEAEDYLATLLAKRQLVNEPQVSIYVKEYVSRGVSIQGAVESPGVYQMIQQRTLLEMLGEAGGISGGSGQRAGRKIFVMRTEAGGDQRRIEIDTEQLIDQGRADLNIPLLPGDVIVVPFAQTHRVYVSGAVFEPGPVEYLSSDGITVLQAITAAGGASERGNLSNVRIVRKLADGSEERIKVNVKKIQNGKREDVPLERNDTVIVGEWFL